MLGRLIDAFFRGLSAFSDSLTSVGRYFEGWTARFGDWIRGLSSGDRWFGSMLARLFSPFAAVTDWLDRGGAGGGCVVDDGGSDWHNR